MWYDGWQRWYGGWQRWYGDWKVTCVFNTYNMHSLTFLMRAWKQEKQGRKEKGVRNVSLCICA